MNDKQANGIIYILMKPGTTDFRFYQKDGKSFVEVPAGTRVVPTNGGWQLHGPDGSSAALDGRPVILAQ
ncbi:MAG TPA: hypothetical protein DDW31_01590 [candidate division Zixibacteria bacterium]|jgi:hypothetical protein|nr:hypothetical protein [candidate division Zixibacteria bacterium]